MRALFPIVGERKAALCATEEGGAHPKAIQSQLDHGKITGRKTFVTFGAEAELLLVVAREAPGPREALPSGGRSEAESPKECTLKVALVEAAAPGVTFEPLPPLPFAPEIGHAQVVLTGAPAEVLPGDGYDLYLKPFRTVEDIHVFGAALAYLAAAGRRARWSGDAIAEIGAVVAALATLAACDPRERETHLVLGGALALGRALIARADLAGLPDDERARWERDRPLLGLAEKVRAQRLAGAVSALGL